MKSKKGSSLSQETVIIFIIILVALVVILLFATGAFDKLIDSLKGSSNQASNLLNTTSLIKP